MTASPSGHTLRPVRPPSVDALARSLADTGLPHPMLVDAARAAIAEGDPEHVEEQARGHAHAAARSMLQPVINATGVLLHTNLGRAPVAFAADAAYTNLELDLSSGQRGSRHAHAAALLARLCDAERRHRGEQRGVSGAVGAGRAGRRTRGRPFLEASWWRSAAGSGYRR